MKIVSQKPDKSPLVRGTTIINHNIRSRANLNLAQYCIVDFLTGWWSNNSVTPTTHDFFLWLGLDDKETIQNLCDQVISLGYVDQSLKPTEKWKEFFNNKEEFETLWKIHPKGNKKTAKDRFSKAIKRIRFKDLKEKLEVYAKSNQFQYLKGLDVWLNPDKEHWNDPVVVATPSGVNQKPEITHNFFKA